jgi:hypothetical protein
MPITAASVARGVKPKALAALGMNTWSPFQFKQHAIAGDNPGMRRGVRLRQSFQANHTRIKAGRAPKIRNDQSGRPDTRRVYEQRQSYMAKKSEI